MVQIIGLMVWRKTKNAVPRIIVVVGEPIANPL
jgi:hypothetical protein